MSEDGVCVAYYHDWSGFAVFGDEVKALRYAVDKTMMCKFVPYGVDVQEWLRKKS